MRFLISVNESSYSSLTDDQTVSNEDQAIVQGVGSLLELYVETEDDSELMGCLQELRDKYLADLDSVSSVAEILGLISWLLRDHQIDNRGESLEQTAERLSDMDSTADSETQRQLLYHLHDAIERIDDLAL